MLDNLELEFEEMNMEELQETIAGGFFPSPIMIGSLPNVRR